MAKIVVEKMYTILQKEKAENFLEQYQSALNEVAQIAKIDLDGAIFYTNEFFNQVFGYKPSELAGSNIDIIVSKESNTDIAKEIWGCVRDKKTWKGQLASERKDGETIYGNITLKPILIDGNIVEYLFIRHDISDLIRETKAARKSEKAKDEFLANMSHEIRTPLNGVIGYAQLLSRMEAPKAVKECANIISQSGDQLMDIVNQILDLSKINSGHLKLMPSWFEPVEELETINRLFLLSALEKNINFSFEVDYKLPALLLCDVQRLKQVMINLIGNAFKFTSNSVKVRVTLLKKEKRKAHILFSVSDNGIGVSKSKQKKIFKPFVQEDASTTKKFGGTGIGLSITSEILSMMDARISLNSAKEKGSEFSFILKVPFAVGKKRIELQNKDGDLRLQKSIIFTSQVCVLVAEDSEINQLLIVEVLNIFGIKSTCVCNGEEAVAAYKNGGHFDMILMDVNMPTMGGLEAAGAIVAMEKKFGIKHTPIIALTANVIAGYRQKCINAGMDDYLGKPFKIMDFERLFFMYLPHKMISIKQFFEYNPDKISLELGISKNSVSAYVDKFLQTAKVELEYMKKYSISGESPLLASIAHKLKGTAALLNFDAIAKKLAAVESGAKNNEKDFGAILCEIEMQIDDIAQAFFVMQEVK